MNFLTEAVVKPMIQTLTVVVTTAAVAAIGFRLSEPGKEWAANRKAEKAQAKADKAAEKAGKAAAKAEPKTAE